MRLIKLITLSLLLSACTTHKTQFDSEKIVRFEDSDLLTRSYQFRLDYLVNNKPYTYLTFEIKDTYRYFQLLLEDDSIISISEIKIGDMYFPEINRCTIFPIKPNDDVNGCFKAFNSKLLELNNSSLLTETISQNEIERKNNQNYEHGMLMIFGFLSPLLIPVAAINLPFWAIEDNVKSTQHEEFKLALGTNEKLETYLEQLDRDHVSRQGLIGSAYLEAGFFGAPSLAFGFEANRVTWIQMEPPYACGGGFLFWGNKCKIGHLDSMDIVNF